MRKEKYEKPQMDIIAVSVADVITTSEEPGYDGGEGWL